MQGGCRQAHRAGGNVGIEQRVGGLEVGGQRRTTVEEVPAAPDEDATDDGDWQVVVGVSEMLQPCK